MRANFALHPNEHTSLAMTRLYKHMRTIRPDYKPKSRYAVKIQHLNAAKPKLKLVK